MDAFDRASTLQLCATWADDWELIAQHPTATLSSAERIMNQYLQARALPGLTAQETGDALMDGDDEVMLALVALCRALWRRDAGRLPPGVVDLDTERERRGPRLGIVATGSGGGELA